ncbi:chemotaxis protein CheC [Halomicrococcus sp. SG-WS-1]|uniref:chemotaxis protein CheC n=1 Tax=Halomicrococcus sp. SG-WS-1 TaxID=3439057 RepID=UPI003F7AFB4A
MRVDMATLRQFNRMAHEGAERAARHLSGLAGVETFVDVTKTNVSTAAGIGGVDRRVGVGVDLDGGLRGRTIFSFTPESAGRLADVLVPDADGVDESAIREVGNVMAGGFIDGWADYLDTVIDISPPEYVEGERAAVLQGEDEDHALAFASRVETIEADLTFAIHLFPERASLGEAFDRVRPGATEQVDSAAGGTVELATGGDSVDGDETTVSVEKLAVFGEMVRRGATSVASNLTEMTGIETTVDVTTLSFVPLEELPGDLRDGTFVGVVFELDGPPSGYVMVLFDEASARDVATALVGDGHDPTSESATFTELDRSAIREVGNVMASSFVDGWANALGTAIEISPPQFVHDLGGAIVDPVAASLSQRQQFTFVSDATIRADDRAFDCSLYALPDAMELREAFDALDGDATAERWTNAGEL